MTKEELFKEIYSKHFDRKISALDMLQLAYEAGEKKGFESFREKADEGVKKEMETQGRLILLLKDSLTTAETWINELKKEIKQTKDGENKTQ